MPPETYGVVYAANHTTITLPTGSFWLLALLALGGLYWYATGLRAWVGEIASRGIKTWN